VSLQPVRKRPGRHDYAKRRRASRKGREKGCSLYIAAEQLEQAGFDPDSDPPYFRVWPASRGGLFVRLYKEA